MRIKILSDLHYDYNFGKDLKFINNLQNDCDVLVLAGDLAEGRNVSILIEAICQRFAQVIYVPGNHEYYRMTKESLWKLFLNLQSNFNNLHVLDNNSIIINNQRFVGSTLWFGNDENNWMYEQYMNDFRLISGFKYWIYIHNDASVKFLSENICEDDIVITHHIPLKQGIAQKYIGQPLNRFFLCDVAQKMIGNNWPKIWVFGHTHVSTEFYSYNTKFICNPMGYKAENKMFDQDKVIII